MVIARARREKVKNRIGQQFTVPVPRQDVPSGGTHSSWRDDSLLIAQARIDCDV